MVKSKKNELRERNTTDRTSAEHAMITTAAGALALGVQYVDDAKAHAMDEDSSELLGSVGASSVYSLEVPPADDNEQSTERSATHIDRSQTPEVDQHTPPLTTKAIQAGIPNDSTTTVSDAAPDPASLASKDLFSEALSSTVSPAGTTDSSTGFETGRSLNSDAISEDTNSPDNATIQNVNTGNILPLTTSTTPAVGSIDVSLNAEIAFPVISQALKPVEQTLDVAQTVLESATNAIDSAVEAGASIAESATAVISNVGLQLTSRVTDAGQIAEAISATVIPSMPPIAGEVATIINPIVETISLNLGFLGQSYDVVSDATGEVFDHGLLHGFL